jgi:hypothetical protein
VIFIKDHEVPIERVKPFVLGLDVPELVTPEKVLE